ncbi:putative polyketide synthase [Amniculicola lignicola CBS 123094]|uniref:Putative polyketide synthase n=1 Tax=Amniculicola lignicola CBS 123094 TaxID=1392246 RepID=A0A6A5X2V2_9PLEO|nr:putative polyketide synthase [Amniculicola lignicola CBS 123094]
MVGPTVSNFDTTRDSIHDVLEPLAIIGYAFKLPGDAISSEAFWSMLTERRNAMTDWPADRVNLDAFYHPDASQTSTIPIRGAHFLKDIASFDSPFFGITPKEACSMDPQHRQLLESAYHALENAGIPLEVVAGTRTGVYTGCFSDDYKHIQGLDCENLPEYHATGTSVAMLANRISWFFNLTGPSVNLDSACSSSMMALDFACQGLRNGDSEMAIVGGTNSLISPDVFRSLSNGNFLSHDSLCYSFDTRANGYSRGEGNATIILKRVSDAIRDGNTIRAIVRATGSCQDGRTPTITRPSQSLQEDLILRTYAKAGLDPSSTAYIEAHGTGTAVGDPTEFGAIQNAFRKGRDDSNPLYIGAVKSNIGHLEGASGIAGVIKTIMVLEKGIIPPNANFEQASSSLDLQTQFIRFPRDSVSWPSRGLRRASVNSFGFGGSNSHAILEDAYHFLAHRGLEGCHSTTVHPPELVDTTDVKSGVGRPVSRDSGYSTPVKSIPHPLLFIFSAADEQGLGRMAETYRRHLSNLDMPPKIGEEYLESLAYTLAARRSKLPWRSFTVAQSMDGLQSMVLSKPIRPSKQPQLVYVFTGQGAQYACMGAELFLHPIFKASMLQSEQFLCRMGCSWSLIDELLRDKPTSRINDAEFSQPICTAIQLALVDLLQSYGVSPSAVVGHSSGEIAAAYCAGALSHESACRVSFFRGQLASRLSSSNVLEGKMMAVGLSETQVAGYLNPEDGVSVACINSPSSITLSGDSTGIDRIHSKLIEAGIFSRMLQVNVAYHSHHMETIATPYLELLQNLETGDDNGTAMISSVTGLLVSNDALCTAEYWVSNMVSPVRFSEALSGCIPANLNTTKAGGTNEAYSLFEIGPHATLKKPIEDTLNGISALPPTSYFSALNRGSPASVHLATTVGHLYCRGHDVSIDRFNHLGALQFHIPPTLSDLPEYPFDHSQTYWTESRLSKEGYRLRKHPSHELLGTPVSDWNPQEARWRNFIRMSQMPWIEDHKMDGTTVYPAAGFLAMAIEALKQVSANDHERKGYTLSEVVISSPLRIPEEDAVETEFHLKTSGAPNHRDAAVSEFRVFSYDNGFWTEHCCGKIRVDYGEQEGGFETTDPNTARLDQYRGLYKEASSRCSNKRDREEMYQHLNSCGLDYGPSFQLLDSIRGSDATETVSSINVYNAPKEVLSPHSHVVHPTTLDCAAQMMLVAISRAGLDTIPTLVPTKIPKLWVSKDGLNFRDNQRISAFATARLISDRKASSQTVLFDKDFQQILAVMDLESTAVALPSSIAEEENMRQRSYYMASQPDIDLLSSAELQSNYYEYSTKEIINRGALFNFMSLLSHKQPSLRILEIGAQTGSLTAVLLEVLEQQEKIGIRFEAYDLTDSASKNLDAAQDRFGRQSSKVQFKVLDIQNDPVSQGFEKGSYDLIIAGMALSHTRNVLSALENSRSLLAPGGKLVIIEARGPYLSTRGWNDVLQKTGFSGVDCEFPDFVQANYHQASILVTTATKPRTEDPKPQVTVIMEEDLPYNRELAEKLCLSIGGSNVSNCQILDLEKASSEEYPTNSYCILLTDFHNPFLAHMEATTLQQLQRLFSAAAKILWVCLGGGSSTNPQSSMMEGFSRVIRCEITQLQLTTLALESGNDGASIIKNIVNVFNNIQKDPSSDLESEYEEKDGLIQIKRVIPDESMSRHLSASNHAQILSRRPFGDCPPVKMKIGAPGLLDSMTFVQDENYNVPLASSEVEIKVSYSGINYRDFVRALGVMDSQILGGEAAGVVTRAGAGSGFQIGDRVVACAEHTVRTYLRCGAETVVKLPDNVPLEDAAALPVTFIAAHYSLQKVAHLEKGESVLIHLGSGAMGQAAIQLAQWIGADIYTGVGSEEKRQFLADRYGIPPDHIFNSRSTAFAQEIQRKTNGRGVDVVLNTLAGDGLAASWECIGSFGRFVELGKRDVLENSKLSMGKFDKNVSFSVVDVSILMYERPKLAGDSLREVVRLVSEGILSPATPLRVFGIGEIEKAFRRFQGGSNIGKIVLEMRTDDVVQTILPKISTCQLRNNATYLIAGGLGGLGRSAARWMVSRGARHLILLSRKGPRTEKAIKFVADLRREGINVRTPSCDITSVESLHTALEQCSDMPPIQGCMQSSMVLKDGVFENMSFSGWSESIAPKVSGSWTLHSLLPPNMDFFIFLSSVSGIIGYGGLASYAGGNTYEDALAHHRVRNGQAATTLDLGWMLSDGVISDNKYLEERISAVGYYIPLTTEEFYALLDLSCSTREVRIPKSAFQPIVGLEMPAAMIAKGIELPGWMSQRTFGHMVSGTSNASNQPSSDAQSYAHALSTSPSISAATEIVCQALMDKLSKALSIPVENIDPSRPLYEYGLDSQHAIELRNWAAKELDTKVAVFDILDKGSFHDVSANMARKSRYCEGLL